MAGTVYRYHVNPQNRVLKCSAATEAECKFSTANNQNTHFQATVEQARGMQDILNQALAKTPKPQPAKVAPPAGIVESTWNGDKLVAVEQPNGRYTISLKGGRVLAKDQGLISGVTREKALKDWAENMAPFGATAVAYDGIDATNIVNPQQITVWDDAKKQDVVVGYVFFSYTGRRGWTPIMSLDELKSDPKREGHGLISACAKVEDMYRQREQTRANAAKGTDAMDNFVDTAFASDTRIREEQAETELRVRGSRVLNEEAGTRALGRMLTGEDRVYVARDDLTASVRRAFTGMKGAGSLKADEGDEVYLHEVRDDDNAVESLTVKWGARSWSHEEITFEYMGKEPPYLEFQAWLDRHKVKG